MYHWPQQLKNVVANMSMDELITAQGLLQEFESGIGGKLVKTALTQGLDGQLEELKTAVLMVGKQARIMEIESVGRISLFECLAREGFGLLPLVQGEIVRRTHHG